MEIEPYDGGNLTNFPNWKSLELYDQKKRRELNSSKQKPKESEIYNHGSANYIH